MAPRVLVVEDEAAIADAIGYALRAEGFQVKTVGDGEHALWAAREEPFDLLVLDLMLPRLSGVEVCRRLREESAVPILMLTAKDAEVDRVIGLESGADDYVTKPFSMPELVARVRAILRRRELDARLAGDGSVLDVGGLHIDLARYDVRVDGRPVHLTPSELKLLSMLAHEPERVFSRRAIMQHLWDSEFVGDERACDLHVSNLRRKIERDADHPQRLVTVRGAGYKLQAL